MLRAFVIVLLGLMVICFQNCSPLDGMSSSSAPSSDDGSKTPPDNSNPGDDDEDDEVDEINGSTKVTHGSEITPAHVGPSAIGITSFVTLAGGGMQNSDTSTYGVDVAGDAVYDGVTVTGPHVLIQGKEISHLDIYADKKIVLRGNKIRGNSWWGINVRPEANGGIYILFNDIGGLDTTDYPGFGVSLSAQAYVYRNSISLTEDGITLGASDITVIENYIHNFAGDVTSHTDGIANFGGEDNVTILRNKVMLNRGDTGAFNFMADYGDMNNWLVDRNYIAGGGWTCYCGGVLNGNQTTNFIFTNNIFGKDFYATVGYWGPMNTEAPNSGGNLFQNNKTSDGVSVDPY